MKCNVLVAQSLSLRWDFTLFRPSPLKRFLRNFSAPIWNNKTLSFANSSFLIFEISRSILSFVFRLVLSFHRTTFYTNIINVIFLRNFAAPIWNN